MGAEPYYYVVPYADDLNAALQKLREREFQAGRYNPAMPMLTFPIRDGSPAPGCQHDSIEEALAEAEEEGTRSILDIFRIGDAPDFGTAGPLSDERLEELFGTTQPTIEMIEESGEFFDDIDRGMCVYIIAYKDGQPDQIYFAGYSFD